MIIPVNVDDREPLKNINFLANLISSLSAYSYFPKKPSIKYEKELFKTNNSFIVPRIRI